MVKRAKNKVDRAEFDRGRIRGAEWGKKHKDVEARCRLATFRMESADVLQCYKPDHVAWVLTGRVDWSSVEKCVSPGPSNSYAMGFVEGVVDQLPGMLRQAARSTPACPTCGRAWTEEGGG